MGDYNIDINVNMGGSQGNFQTLIDSVNKLNASFEKILPTVKGAGAGTKQAFGESAAIMEKFGFSTQKVAEEIKRLQKAIKEEALALKQNNQTQEQYIKNVQKHSAEIKRLQTAQQQYNKTLDQTVGKTKAASAGFAGLTTAFNKLAAVLGVSFGLYGFFRVLTSVIKTIAEFDLAQKKLQSILGETAAGMKEISESAVEIGKTSIFGAAGVSMLQIELAKMGFTKKEIMAMQSAIIDLATATQEDLASSAETVANILKTFNLSATETRDVVNVMGKAFNDSALGLANFREAIKYVAPVAYQAGLSFRETVAAMELLANAGLKGSLTGTAFNNVLKAMMDSNSKLSKQMGGTVEGWEGFVSVLKRAKEEGWNMSDIFGLITQRATGAFAIFLDGIDTMEDFKVSLTDISDVMRNQAAVQLDSITYKAELLKNAWAAFILEIDKGDKGFSNFLKNFMSGVTVMLNSISADDKGIADKLGRQMTDIREALSLDNISEDVRIALMTQYDMLKKYYIVAAVAAQREGVSINKYLLESITNTTSKSGELLSKVVVDAANARVASMKIIGKTNEEFEANRTVAMLMIGQEIEMIKAQGKEFSFEMDVLIEAFTKIEQLRFKRDSEIQQNEDELKKKEDARLKILKERYDYELRIIKLKSGIKSENVKLATDEYTEDILLAIEAFNLKKKILDKELERDIALGENKVRTKNIYNLELQNAELEHQNKIQDITDKMQQELLKSFEEVNKDVEGELKESNKNTEQQVKEFVDSIINEYKRLTEIGKYMDQFAFENPIINMLFGDGIKKDLLSGLIDEDDVDNFVESWGVAFDSIGDSLNDYVDSWVEATDRIVEQLNRQIDETQSALETEISLMEAGYASNVTLKKKELEDLKKVREKALQDQKQAQQAQVAIDTITQISSLITASAQIIKGFSKIPVVGVPLGIAAVIAMIGAFAAAKAKAIQTAGINKYAEGGWIGGRRHSEGGTMIEAEKGEFMIKRNSAIKHRDLIEAINKDDKYEINRIYLNKIKGQVLSARVSLDDSKDLKAIRALMEKSERNVEYQNGYRIERIGNITTKIRLN